MKKKLCLMLTILSLLFACGCDSIGEPSAEPYAEPSATSLESTAPEALPTPTLSQREREWLEDLEFLREACKTQHIDPFYLCSEEEFDWKLDQLSAKVGTLSDNDIALEIVSIVAGLGDIHSHATPPRSYYERGFPVGIIFFGDRAYLTGYLEGFEQFQPYLLREVVAVNGVDMAYLKEQARRLGNPFNSWLSQEAFWRSHFRPAFFDWAGCDYREGYTLQILNENREVESVEVPVVDSEEFAQRERNYAPEYESLFYLEGQNFAKYVEGPEGGCVYMSLVHYMWEGDVRRLILESGELFEAHPDCDKLVVDLRMSPGGNAKFVSCFQEDYAKGLTAGQVYVLTGGYTGSASLSYIAVLKDTLGAVTVGEPTGQFTSFFHMQSSLDKPVVLPNSQISVMLSNSWWDGDPLVEVQYDENGKLYPWESMILPDVYVYQDIEDIRQGLDSVIEWVLAQ